MSANRFQRLRELFDAASELDPEAREAYLRQACAGSDELLREVQALLSLEHTGNPFLEQGLAGLSELLPPGAEVGPYRVIRELGRGGMGVVYLAEDTRLHRKVALKALRPGLQAVEKQRARFRREAGMAAGLSHPGIATIYALEEWDSNQFIVSEYVEGVTLETEFEQGPLTTEQVLNLGLQLAAAIDAAHERGVLHRDLKPQNVMRTTNGRLKILDFGLAVAHEPDGQAQTRLTDAGALLGTPAYMSPEQLRGEPADFRSDLFALGVVMSMAATGIHPFTGKTVAVTMAAILAAEPHGLEQLRRKSAALEPVIRRCLHKDPAQRFQSAAELHQALAGLTTSAPTLTPRPMPISGEYRLGRRWWLGHQVGIVTACVLLTGGLWLVSEWAPDRVTRYAFVGGLAIASVIVSLRLHLIFTYRRNRSAIFRELSGVMPWARRADWAFCAILAITGLDVAADRRLVAACLLGAAAAYAIVFLFAEPSTRSSVFEDSDDG